jgi:hypothetical protein
MNLGEDDLLYVVVTTLIAAIRQSPQLVSYVVAIAEQP